MYAVSAATQNSQNFRIMMPVQVLSQRWWATSLCLAWGRRHSQPSLRRSRYCTLRQHLKSTPLILRADYMVGPCITHGTTSAGIGLAPKDLMHRPPCWSVEGMRSRCSNSERRPNKIAASKATWLSQFLHAKAGSLIGSDWLCSGETRGTC